jgi:hypothetical protein
MTIDKVEEYLDTINLNDYGLGGVEISEEDMEEIADKVNETGCDLEDAVDDVLYGIREILDQGLDDIEDEY